MLDHRRRFRSSADRQRRRGRRYLAGPERLEERTVFSGAPFGSMPDDTAEYLLGDVYVTLVLLESSAQTSTQNNNSENWTPASIAGVKQRVQEGLNWWKETLATKTDKHELNFEIDFTYADNPVITNYEPITRTSNDFQFWIYDFLDEVGYNTRGNYHSDIRAFNNAQRTAYGSDWAYTIFVVNDENDLDDQFAPGGFSRAFAFAGGEFLVSLASRPASTYSHETGHIFWAYDEYRPDGNYERSRGYYNTQNLNSWDNPTPGFTQQPSIMTKDQLLATAYDDRTSAQTTFEMVGWKDSDGDGVFDVLDVPLTLTGSGFYDVANGEYRFTGTSAVQTLPNRNPSGIKNDITLNQVSRAQYRIDGGAWQTAATFNAYSATLDLRFAVPSTATSVDIRTIDDTTGITSPVFQGSTSRPSGVLLQGINGVVWSDVDGDGALDVNERGVANVQVELVDASGQPLQLHKTVEPDDHSSTARLNTVQPAVTLTAVGSGVADDTVASLTASNASTGDQVFASFSSSCGGYCTDWTTDSRQLRMEFPTPVSTLTLDAIGSSIPGIARLEVFNSENQLLARYTTKELSTGQIETMTLTRQIPDIKFAVARSHNNTVIRFDNLRFGPKTSALTDANGTYSLSYLNGGQYRVQLAPVSGRQPTNPSDGSQNVVLGEGEAKGGVDFGVNNLASAWQNPVDRFDVNNDGAVTPNDVLRIINKLNTEGARPLDQSDTPPPFVDVNGDFSVTSNDVLQLINEINRRSTGGEAEPPVAAFVPTGIPNGQGESEAAQAIIEAESEGVLLVSAGRNGFANTESSSHDHQPAATRRTDLDRPARQLLASSILSPVRSSSEVHSDSHSRLTGSASGLEDLFADELFVDDELVSLLAHRLT